MSGDDWREQAACRGRHEVMFLTVFRPIAAKLCGDCPVRSECLADALETEVAWDDRCHAGFRAGMTPVEFINYRRRWRRRQRKETA